MFSQELKEVHKTENKMKSGNSSDPGSILIAMLKNKRALGYNIWFQNQRNKLAAYRSLVGSSVQIHNK